MILDRDIAVKTAELLLQIKAIKLQPEDPFTWASGWKSPIYCDNRVSLSYPPIRTFLREQLSDLITEQFGKPELIAGVATGAIAHGILVAQYLNLPFVYVRPEEKKHGRQNKIEGYFEPGANVVVVEDLISTGMSSLKAVAALREAGCNVKGLVSLFSYGFEDSKIAFRNAECPQFSLSDYNHLIEQALESGYLTEAQGKALAKWRVNPAIWEPAI